ncbi:MAG: hypothetical protein QOE86_3654 [Solirubrobacteraceae bacterium]|nr:hypothetical protein [Solirubrobacteraceae bacterium]
MAAGTVHVPWYATLFRGDRFAQALETIAPVALRYGARDFAVYRSRDDGYKYLQTATFANKLDWDRYWIGPEFMAFREEYTSWYQVPVLYVWHDVLIQGRAEVEEPV